MNVAREARRRVGAALLLAGLLLLLGALIWACFLRPPPRSLALTLIALTGTRPLALAGSSLLLTGAALLVRQRNLLAAVGGILGAGWLLGAGLIDPPVVAF